MNLFGSLERRLALCFSGMDAGSLFLWNGCWLQSIVPRNRVQLYLRKCFIHGPKLVYYNASKPSTMRC